MSDYDRAAQQSGIAGSERNLSPQEQQRMMMQQAQYAAQSALNRDKPNSVMEDLRLRGDEVEERLRYSIDMIEGALDRFYGHEPQPPMDGAKMLASANMGPAPALVRMRDVMSRLAEQTVRLKQAAERLDTIA